MLKNEPVTALLIHIVIILNARFKVSSFNQSRDIRGWQNYNRVSHDLHITSYYLTLHFFVNTH